MHSYLLKLNVEDFIKLHRIDLYVNSCAQKVYTTVYEKYILSQYLVSFREQPRFGIAKKFLL